MWSRAGGGLERDKEEVSRLEALSIRNAEYTLWRRSLHWQEVLSSSPPGIC